MSGLRKPVAAALELSANDVLVICDDGAVFRRSTNTGNWSEQVPIPGTFAANRREANTTPTAEFPG